MMKQCIKRGALLMLLVVFLCSMAGCFCVEMQEKSPCPFYNGKGRYPEYGADAVCGFCRGQGYFYE